MDFAVTKDKTVDPPKYVIFFKARDADALNQVVKEYSAKQLDKARKGINAAMKKASARMKVITGIQNAVADCQTHQAVHDKYLKIGWKARQAAFAESHKDELDSLPPPRRNCSR